MLGLTLECQPEDQSEDQATLVVHAAIGRVLQGQASDPETSLLMSCRLLLNAKWRLEMKLRQKPSSKGKQQLLVEGSCWRQYNPGEH